MTPEPPDYVADAAQRARARLDDAAHALQAQIEHSAALTAEFASEIEPLPDEQVAAIRDAYVNGPCAAEWSAVAARISRGELTWREIAEGDAFNDPDVRAALQATFEGARDNPAEQPVRTRADAPSRSAAVHDDDSDYYGSTEFLRG